MAWLVTDNCTSNPQEVGHGWPLFVTSTCRNHWKLFSRCSPSTSRSHICYCTSNPTTSTLMATCLWKHLLQEISLTWCFVAILIKPLLSLKLKISLAMLWHAAILTSRTYFHATSEVLHNSLSQHLKCLLIYLAETTTAICVLHKQFKIMFMLSTIS